MTTPSAKAIDSLVSFYLGRLYDLDRGECEDDLLMYDAKDLCTHAMCVGMTGSGKTGLCISLLGRRSLHFPKHARTPIQYPSSAPLLDCISLTEKCK